jgi:hypothetical protein
MKSVAHKGKIRHSGGLSGGPEGIRTPDLRFRKATHYLYDQCVIMYFITCLYYF